MSETIKVTGENQNTQSSNGYESLSKIEFNKEKAEQLVREKEAQLGKTEHLTVMPKAKAEKIKPVNELTPEEASKEYLDLLSDLSQNFTSAEGKIGKVARYDKDGNIQIVSEQGYSNFNNGIVRKLHGGQDIDRELSLNMADKIISAESDWRAAGESTTIESEQKEITILEQEHLEAKAKLEKIEHGVFGKLKKAFYVNFRNKEYNRLQSLASRRPQTQAEENSSEANRKLREALEWAYSEDYGHSRHSLSFEHSQQKGYRERMNEEYNNRFFSPERKAKIDRAIELRRKLEADKLIKK